MMFLKEISTTDCTCLHTHFMYTLCTCTYTCIHCRYVHRHIPTHMYIHIYIHENTHTYSGTRTSAIHLHICTYTYTYMKYTYIHQHTCTHTYSGTHMSARHYVELRRFRKPLTCTRIRFNNNREKENFWAIHYSLEGGGDRSDRGARTSPRLRIILLILLPFGFLSMLRAAAPPCPDSVLSSAGSSSSSRIGFELCS